jgi:hypothetical protein
MKIGIGGGIGHNSGRGGGSGVAPITTSSLSGSDITFTSDQPGTYFNKWTASATALPGASIESGYTTSQAIAAGTGYVTFTDSGLAIGTWYLHQTVKNAAGLYSVDEVETWVVAAPAFSETWSAYTAGNNWTQLDTAYARSSSSLNSDIAAHANPPAPAGKKLLIGVASANPYRMDRDDITAALAARTTEDVDVLVKFICPSGATNTRFGMGYLAPGDLNWGIFVNHYGAGNTVFGIHTNDDINSIVNYTALVNPAADGAVYYCRFNISGVNLRGQFWLHGGSDPGGWAQTRTVGAAISFPRLDLTARVAAQSLEILGYTVSIGGTAASF